MNSTRYLVDGGDGICGEFSTIEDAVIYGEEILAEMFVGVHSWPEEADKVRVLKVVATPQEIIERNPEGSESAAYGLVVNDCSGVRDLTTQLAAATARADAAERERDAAVKVLREVERIEAEKRIAGDKCPICQWQPRGGHAPNCALAACLKGGAE